jgi:lactate dehydrogenase-like 2-hydroxyacid dehydrogenase
LCPPILGVISDVNPKEMFVKPEILQIAPMQANVEAGLADGYIVHRWWDAPDRAALLAEVGPRLRGVATDGHFGIPKQVLDAAPKLEIVASYGVGYDNIDTAACRARGIRVTNTPDVLNDAVAEITVGLMIALARRLPQADAYVRAGRWPAGTFPLTAELTGAHAGILGLGRIGKEIARRLQAMKMRISYHGRREQSHEPYAYYPSLEAMARDVDWLIVIAPGSAATRGIVSRSVLEALGPEGYLVNVARGALIDEPALVDLLTSGRLAGAALDVFADEPNVPAALFALDNVVLSPHQGSATTKTRNGMGALVLDNLAAHFAGRPLLTPVV